MFDFETTPPWVFVLAIFLALTLLSPFLLRARRRRMEARRQADMARLRKREVDIWDALQASRSTDKPDQEP